MTQRLDYTNVAPAGVKALGGVYGYITQSGLPTQLVNLVYLRVSQINGCAFCIDMHSRDLLKNGLAIEKLVLVQAWHEAADLFDVRERSALAWAETVTRVADTAVPDADFQAASAVFSESCAVSSARPSTLAATYAWSTSPSSRITRSRPLIAAHS